MSLSIQTNVAALSAENNIRVNSNFQNQTINRLSSGYRINSSADDAAGLAVANQLQGTVTELTQGVQNANNSVSQLQVIDGGLSNITQILSRLQTLATESASNTFTGDRATLNAEYQSDLGEINRQAANIGLNTGGQYNSQLNVFTAGGNTQANSQVSIDLSGANNAVDTNALGIGTTSVAGGGTGISGNTVRLDDSAATFLAGSGTQDFTFHVNNGSGDQLVTATVSGGTSGLNGQGVISSLNSQLQAYGISAGIASDGTLQFAGSTAFSVSAAAGSAGTSVASAGTAVNTANYNSQASGFAAFTDGGGTTASETVVFQNAGGTKSVTLDSSNASTLSQALQTLNGALAGTGISAVTNSDGTSISFQSSNTFSIDDTAYTAGLSGGTGQLFSDGTSAASAVSVTSPTASSSSTGNALAALSALQTAVSNLGLVQGVVGAGENKLNFAVNLSQSQITNYSAEESGIRDADVAAEAANLTKAQVLQQASIAALAQANQAPQAVLSLLKG
jgi:flagellin